MTAYRFLIVIAALLSAAPLAALDRGALDRAVTAFEAAKGRAAVVLLDASTARVLYCSDAETVVNRRYPPGSLAKPWSAVVLMERGYAGFDPDGPVDCDGSYRPPASIPLTPSERRRFNLATVGGAPAFRCSLARGHGAVGLHEAIARSCNVYFLTRAAARPAALAADLTAFWHLDENTGARDLAVRELPVPHTAAAPAPFTALVAAIGEGGLVRVSPLKAAQLYAALFQGTPLLRPQAAPQAAPVEHHPLPITESHRRRVLAALAAVVREGTLKGLAAPGKRILAGKTGTATVQGKKYATHGWAVVHVVQEGRSLVLAVFVSRGSGSREARELAQKVLDAL